MKFPIIGDIASKSVIFIDVKSSMSDAIEMMFKNGHRNIIIKDNDVFRILTVVDILNIQSKNIDLEAPIKDFKLSIVPTINRYKNVLDTIEFLNGSVEYICVTNEDGSLYGLVTHTDITSNIDPDTLMDNYRLHDLLRLGSRMKWVNKDDKTSTLLSEMTSSSFDNVIVVEDSRPLGILTTKDVMKLIKDSKKLDLPISTYMSSPVNTINKSASIKEALDFIKQMHYKRVVVVDDEGLLVGIVSQKELISLTYSRWAMLMKEYHEELTEINSMLENKNREYAEMASTDSLTGLYNRHKFSELFLSSYASMTQRENDMSLIILDIDYFKKINDNFGHNAGDKVLIQVSHSLLKTLRNLDIICRWGGEEFVILLPTASLEKGVYLAEKLRIYIQELDLGVIGKISASFGVSQVIEGDSMESVVERADKALYLAKSSGRNCVKTESDL
ncbi:diguanylate cyclase [Candidatus Sulfurimonas baltica]|uniref:diguanylate cyclase n=1 Tax=Candidatus Sulfurimonas baltica TaxID=2740404 RepID=A0A7S7LV76_9BACT|nr:diguanylate cyclase [Candidatus Sulfurimonas baltica]QOY51468.1 diguanylate cyclase [Candidatus Sulfurimonas baltica]